jgi:hypothetical protein
MINLTLKKALKIQLDEARQGVYMNIYRETQKGESTYYLLPCDYRDYTAEQLRLVEEKKKLGISPLKELIGSAR